jgi:hypothetical protein
MGIELPKEKQAKEPKEIDLAEGYEVVCECETEQEQQELFEKLQAEGIKCRILTL